MFRRTVETCATGRSVLNLTVTENAPQGSRTLTEFDMDKLNRFWSLMSSVYILPSLNKLAKSSTKTAEITATGSSSITLNGFTVELGLTLSHTHGATEAELNKIIAAMTKLMSKTTEEASTIKSQKVLTSALIGIVLVDFAHSLVDYVTSTLSRPFASTASQHSEQ